MFVIYDVFVLCDKFQRKSEWWKETMVWDSLAIKKINLTVVIKGLRRVGTERLLLGGAVGATPPPVRHTLCTRTHTHTNTLTFSNSNVRHCHDQDQNPWPFRHTSTLITMIISPSPPHSVWPWTHSVLDQRQLNTSSEARAKFYGRPVHTAVLIEVGWSHNLA